MILFFLVYTHLVVSHVSQGWDLLCPNWTPPYIRLQRVPSTFPCTFQCLWIQVWIKYVLIHQAQTMGICLILYDYIQGRQHSTTRGCFKLPQSYDWLAAVASNWMDFTSRLPSMSHISMLSIITIHQTQIQSFLHTRTVCYHIWQGMLAMHPVLFVWKPKWYSLFIL